MPMPTGPAHSRRLARLIRWRLRRSRRHAQVRLLLARPHVSAARTIVLRGALVAGLFAAVLGVFWLDRDGLKDAADGAVSFLDVVYFTMVTVTTVGYGDIVPHDTAGRLVGSALMLTGLALIPTLTSAVVSVLIAKRGRAEKDAAQHFQKEQMARLARIEERLAALDGRRAKVDATDQPS